MHREELAFVRDVIDALPDAVVVLNTDRTVRTANRAFFQSFDLAEDATIGSALHELGSGQWNHAELDHLLERVITKGDEIRNFHLKFAAPRRGEQMLQLNARRLWYDHQPLVVLAIENITRRLLNTQELERSKAELVRSNQELERFAFLAAHDLQAPLQTIISYLNLLVERYRSKLGTDADDFFQFTINSATHLQQMTHGLLTLARVNQQAPHFEPVDCQQVVDGALGNLLPAIELCGATVSNDPLPTVTGDRAQLTQLFQNLIENAIKFRGEAPPEIHIGVDEHADYWLFSVQDDGVGIEADYLGNIFDLFQRAHHYDEYEGSGIGLTIARKIVEHHGGRIWVESTPGKHTVFYFTIARQLGQ